MKYLLLSKIIKENRVKTGLSSAAAASKLKISKAYYSRLENAKEKPSEELLLRIAQLFSIPAEDVELLKRYAGLNTSVEVDSVNSDMVQQQGAGGVNVRLDPQKLMILFSDAMYVSVSENGVVLDFGQKVGPTNDQTIVARVGVSYQHARKIHDLLGKQLKKAKTMGFEN